MNTIKTKNVKTRKFIQFFTTDVNYVTKDENGHFRFSRYAYDKDIVVGIGISTDSMVKAGIKYTFGKNDICRLLKNDNTTYSSPVSGISGRYIILDPVDIGNHTPETPFVCEIYKVSKMTVGEINKLKAW